MNYEIAPYSAQLRPGIIALYRHLLSPHDALNDAYFRWKHESNPYTSKPLVYVALHDGKVAGMRAFQGARWRLGTDDGTASWLCACDTVVDPAHRGRHLFRRIMAVALADLARQGFGAIVNWSASPVTYAASLRTGWQLVAPYMSWGRQSSRARGVRALSSRMRRWPLAWRYSDVPAKLMLRPGFARLDARWPRRKQAHAALTLSDHARPDAMARLVQRTEATRVCHVRDATYFKWRFAGPLGRYRFAYWDESELEGFVVLHAAGLGDGADLSIVEWEVARPEIFEAILQAVVNANGHDSLSMWSATLPPRMLDALQRVGLEPMDMSRGDPHYRPGLIAIGPGGTDLRIAGDSESAYLQPAAQWDLRMAYSDFY